MKIASTRTRCSQCHSVVVVKISKPNKNGLYKESLHCPECGYRRTKMVKPVTFASVRKAQTWNPNQPIGKGAKAKDLLQPFDKKGNLSYEFLSTYGDKALGTNAKARAKEQFG